MTATRRSRVAVRLAGEERRRQIIQIAMDQIATKGFEGLRFQEVARAARINNATLYHYFPSKEALVQAVVRCLGEELRARRVRLVDGPKDARDELRLEFEDVRQLMRENPKLFVVIAELELRALRDPKIRAMRDHRDEQWECHLLGILERGIAQGAFRSNIDAGEVVTALITQIKGIGYHVTMARRRFAEMDAVISLIHQQVDRWLTSGAGKAHITK